MIEITERAREYLAKLVRQQDESGLGLRIAVRDAGTPRAECDLKFCADGTQLADDHAVDCGTFKLFVASDSVDWLDEAQVDYEPDPTGGQLAVRAPNIKGQAPDQDAPADQRVRWVIDSEINPGLAAHGGVVSLVEITGDQKAVLRFGGGCHGCGMADVTLKQGIERVLLERVPELTGIVDATDHASGENPYYRAGDRGRSAL